MSQVLRRTWLNIVFGDQATGKMFLTDLINLGGRKRGWGVGGVGGGRWGVVCVRGSGGWAG